MTSGPIIYISADLEGICGVVSPKQCYAEKDKAAYTAACHWMAEEVATVATAALEAGASLVIVNDAHGAMVNLDVSAFGEGIRVLSGKPKRCAMVSGFDLLQANAQLPDALMLVGYHAKAGSQGGVLCHTFHNRLLDVSINGVSYGEGGINALYASLCYGIPVIFASGDRAFCQEISHLLPALTTLETKQGLGYAAALNHPRETVLTQYDSQVKAVMGSAPHWKQNLLALSGPYEVVLTFDSAMAGDAVAMMPGWRRLDGVRLAYETADFQTACQAIQSGYAILAYLNNLE